MQKPGRQRAGWVEFQHFLKQDIHVNFSVRGKKTNYFSWMLSILFGINKMASVRRLRRHSGANRQWQQSVSATLAGAVKEVLRLTGIFALMLVFPQLTESLS